MSELEQIIMGVPDTNLKSLYEITQKRLTKRQNDIVAQLKEAGFGYYHYTGTVMYKYTVYVRDYKPMEGINANICVKHGEIGICELNKYDKNNANVITFTVSYEDVLNAKEIFNSYHEKMMRIYTILNIDKLGAYAHGHVKISSKNGRFWLDISQSSDLTAGISLNYQCTYDKLEPTALNNVIPVRIHDNYTFSTDIETPDAKIGILVNPGMKNKLILIDDRLHFCKQSSNRYGDDTCNYSKLSFPASESIIKRIQKKMRKL
jgi:hypothetical protein